jgi:hypothetical protein
VTPHRVLKDPGGLSLRVDHRSDRHYKLLLRVAAPRAPAWWLLDVALGSARGRIRNPKQDGCVDSFSARFLKHTRALFERCPRGAHIVNQKDGRAVQHDAATDCERSANVRCPLGIAKTDLMWATPCPPENG